MSQIPDYTNVSLALSEVLSELGLNDVIVKKRRRLCLMVETMGTILWILQGYNVETYLFGSQSEGTTTIGLDSDVDKVDCFCVVNLIRELADWKNGVPNLLMVEDEATPPGYCMLQVLREDAPVPATEFINEHFFRDRQGRILLKNTLYMQARREGEEQHGPALLKKGKNGTVAQDSVPAFTCISQLPVVKHWLSRLHGQWPSEDMKRYIASSPCFVVPVGSSGSVNKALEWRISTSLAERCLMFSLNVTQLQVYVLMKMLLKTCINCNVLEESHHISSFMCKTVVLHCVQNTAPNFWQSHMLIQCLLFSLRTLYICLVFENCPHFIIRSNNLMAHRFTQSQQAKYQLLTNLRCLLGDIVSQGILSIYFDDVADRLMRKINVGILGRPNDKECQIICFVIGVNCAKHTHGSVEYVLTRLREDRLRRPITLQLLQQFVLLSEKICRLGNKIERSACRLLRPYFYTTLGSLLASENIQNSGIISNQALYFFSRGLNSDVASSRLKLASVFFCAGEMERAETTLRDLEGKYDINVCLPVCGCTSFEWQPELTTVESLSLASDEFDIPKLTSACVIFTQAEKNCIPKELIYEMYRSTRVNLQQRTIYGDLVDWAVVDSLPYLHFLCYKVYGQLQRRADQQTALYNLMVAIQRERYLGHKETALNLLGQCMEQENRWNYALQCYSRSLNIRRSNNAAHFHVCRLLYLRYRHYRV